MFLLDDQQKFALFYAIMWAVVGILFIVAIAFLIRRLVRYHKMGKKANEVSNEDVQELLNAFGGNDNITEVTRELSRITVTVVDVEKVDGEKLKGMGASGVLLVGNKVKCSFNELSENIYKLLERK